MNKNVGQAFPFPFFFLLFIVSYQIFSTSGKVNCNSTYLSYDVALNYCSELRIRGKLTKGTLCLLRTEQVRPTQMAVGKVAVHCAIRQIEKKNGTELIHYLHKQQVPTIIGPNDTFYITDRHHLSTALFEANLDFKSPMKHRALYACINENYSNIKDMPAFWKRMHDTGNAYLKDEYGNDITWDQIPPGLKQLADDPYRTLSRWVRNSNGYIKCGSGKKTRDLEMCKKKGDAPFYVEFLWGNFFKAKLPKPTDKSKYPYIHPELKNYIFQTNYQSQIVSMIDIFEEAMRVATDPTIAGSFPGFNESPDIMKPVPVAIDKHGCDSKDEA